MKTTLLELSEAVRLSWGFDIYDGAVEDEIVDLDSKTGSIADLEGDKFIDFKILETIDEEFPDYEIEVINLEEFPEIEENLNYSIVNFS